MWALIEKNKISGIFTNPKSLIINDVKYPASIFNDWSESDLKDLGIYTIIEDAKNFADPFYYVNTNQEFTFKNNKVTASFGKATPKDLDDSEQNGFATPGLKSICREKIKSAAYSLLKSSDWYVIRKAEAGIEIPEAWETYRSAVRAKANEMDSLINDVKDVPSLQALYVYDPKTQTRPLGEWPESPDV
tara:strand:+ start:2474 stop:3040 length:567 start_codon:yes stop_codon:yes gene_type:complete